MNSHIKTSHSVKGKVRPQLVKSGVLTWDLAGGPVSDSLNLNLMNYDKNTKLKLESCNAINL
jgi:hypothetical protein